jgi:hypothetical protein
LWSNASAINRHPEQSEGPHNIIEDLRDPSLSLRMTIE